MAPAIGIDLGTTYSCVGVFQNNKVEIIANEQGNRTTPSYVAFTDAERLIGDAAKNQAALNATNTIYDAKRLIGRKYDDVDIQKDMETWPFTVIDDAGKPKIEVQYKGLRKLFYPEEVSSMVLMKMKEIAEAYLGELVTDAVITVPAYFNDSQRQATRDAGTIARLNVLRVINEPTAAAIAYGLQISNKEERNVLIFDLGGGTFDVSVLTIEDSIFEVKATDGDTHLGGEDFDIRMIKHFSQEFERKHKKDLTVNKKSVQRLRTACERAKRTLSSATVAAVEVDSLFEGIDFQGTITRARFEELNADLFKSTIPPIEKALRDAGLYKCEIDDIVLVGGSTRIPKIQKLVQDFFEGKEICKSINPDEAVAYGAAAQAAVLHGDDSEEIMGLALIDVTPLSLGVDIVGDKLSTIIERNTSIPTEKTRRYHTVKDFQTSILHNIYEGERPIASKNNLLGKLVTYNIPPAPAGEGKVDVTFHLDTSGILTATGVEVVTKKQNRVNITLNKGRLTSDEIDKLIAEADKMSLEDKSLMQINEARVNLEYYCINAKSRAENKDISLADRENVVKLCSDSLTWLQNDSSLNREVLETKLNEVMQVVNPIINC